MATDPNFIVVQWQNDCEKHRRKFRKACVQKVRAHANMEKQKDWYSVSSPDCNPLPTSSGHDALIPDLLGNDFQEGHQQLLVQATKQAL